MYSYAQAETVLARLYGADENDQRGAFRGRLKHLKRLGIPIGSRPGKGRKIQYDLSQIHQWAFCLELSEFGIDPSITARIVQNFWDGRIKKWFVPDNTMSVPGQRQRLFFIHPKLMSRSWLEPANQNTDNFPEFLDFGVVSGADVDLHLRRRVCFINISGLVRDIETQINHVLGGSDGNGA